MKFRRCLRLSVFAVALFSFSATSLTSTGEEEVPTLLRVAADCMYQILKTAPDVTAPKLSNVTSDGWTHPILEYYSNEKSHWIQPTRFEAQPGVGDRYTFLALLPGTPGTNLDFHVTVGIVEKWKAQCNVDITMITV